MKAISFTAAISLLLLSACKETPDYDATGIFEATTVTVAAETSGRIIDFTIDEGDTIALGQPIAVIDTTMLVLQQKQIDSQRNSTESSSPDISVQASALRARIDHQKQEVDRLNRLIAAGATTQKSVDDATAALTALRSELSALLSSLGKNKTSISDNATALSFQSQQITEQIIKSIIVAPITGTILIKYAEQGEFATPGRALCTIADLNQIYLRAYFTADRLADISIGREVTVIADFGGTEQFEYPGRITWIAEQSEFTPKSIQTNDSRANLVYAVKIAVDNRDGRLKLGQYGEVRL